MALVKIAPNSNGCNCAVGLLQTKNLDKDFFILVANNTELNLDSLASHIYQNGFLKPVIVYVQWESLILREFNGSLFSCTDCLID